MVNGDSPEKAYPHAHLLLTQIPGALISEKLILLLLPPLTKSFVFLVAAHKTCHDCSFFTLKLFFLAEFSWSCRNKEQETNSVS